MRRQIGAWAAPIASSSAGLRFQVAIVDGRRGRAIACSGWGTQAYTVELTFGLPGFHQQRARDHRAEQDDAGGDRGEHAVEAEAQPFDGEPAAGVATIMRAMPAKNGAFMRPAPWLAA